MTEKIEHAMHLAGRTRFVLLAVVDETGTPRLTPVEQCTQAGADRVAVQAWVDAPSMVDQAAGSRVALLIWDEAGGGYQLTGQVVRQQEAAILNGLAEIEQEVRFPQVERFLLMQISAIEDFHFAPFVTGRP